MRVLAAMSGGVDSAVAAARAVEAGHDVVGVHLALSRSREAKRNGSRGCCTIEDAGDARRAADRLDIPFYVWDLAERFEADVIDDFIAEYTAGRTPNPCVRCNERIKFAALLDKAIALGFDAVATGHYAHLEQNPDAGHGPLLGRSRDLAKDQSYVLAVVSRDRLRRAMFPLGDAENKDAVREEAAARGLTVANKPDSHDICFIPDGDTRAWLAARVPSEPGAILDESGAQVGTHSGATGYTVGQRRGLRLGHPAPDGRPRFVLDVSVTTNTVTVGPVERLAVTALEASGVIWHRPRPVVGARLLAQVRAHGRTVGCTVEHADDDRVVVAMEPGLSGVAAGQALVLYDLDDRVVIGAATIEAVR